MSRNEAGFHLVDWVVLLAIIGIVWVVTPMVKEKIKVISANKSCLDEAEAYAASAKKALGSRKVPATPLNHSCRETTDASHGASLDTRIYARAREPGTARVVCNLTLRAPCTIP